MYETLECRRFLSATAIINGETIQMDDGAAIAAHHWIGFRSGDDVFGVTGGYDRFGLFDLPTVKADGSVRLAGTADADTITAEAVTGVHEQTDDQGRPVDKEFDFVNGIDPQTGERFTLWLHNGGIASAQREARSNLTGAQYYFDAATGATADADYAERLERASADFASAKQAVRRVDALATAMADGSFVHYTLAGAYDFYAQVAADQPGTAKLTIDAGGGNDTVSISPNVPLRGTVYGGSGADVLTSGKRTSYLYGGGGNDRLISRSTKGGTLDGGKGGDRYYNRAAFGEVQIAARDDGDQIMTASDAVRVRSAGTLGVDSTAATGRRYYFLVDDGGGQVDLLG